MTARKGIPIGVDHFAKLMDPQKNYIFVDKSLFIKEIIDDRSEVTLITRPRRWGKTLNMSMLEHFLAPEVIGMKTEGMFDQLAIARVENGHYITTHQGQHPVVFVSFKDIKEANLSRSIDSMRGLFQALFSKHETYLLDSPHLTKSDQEIFLGYLRGSATKTDIQNGLLRLTTFLYKHYHKPVYLLIDEYDTPLNYAYTHQYLDEMTEFMKNMLSAALKGNPYLAKGVMTGILRISKDSMLSGLNNVEVYSVLDAPYATHFGFNEKEVSRLFSDSQLTHESVSIRTYYNGYRMGDEQCYNPWSIMQCLKNNGMLKPYWVHTADDPLLRDSFLQATAEMKEQLQMLISGGEPGFIEVPILETIRFEDIASDEITLWSLLVATGYLTPLRKEQESIEYHCTLAIPNEEVKQLYISIFKSWFSEKLNNVAYYSFLDDLVTGRIDRFTQKLEQYLLTHASYHDFTQESHYHTFMLGLLCSLTHRYWLYSNAEAGLGRADMILVPRNTNEHHAIIMEFKRDITSRPSPELAAAALAQIDHRQYKAFIARHATIDRILKIGIVFNGKQVASCHRWESEIDPPL